MRAVLKSIAMSDPFLQMDNFKRNEKIEDSKSKVPQSP
jgi:hypothetical protein